MGQREALANFFIVLMPLAVGLVLALFVVNAHQAPRDVSYLALGSFFVGVALFLVAKLSVVRSGVRISFGSSSMSPWHRRAYRAGYFLMGLGCLSVFALVSASSSR